MELSVTIRRGIGRTLVSVSGEIDLSTSRLLLDALQTAVRWYDARLLLDLAAVTFLDCAGLSAMLKAQRCAEAAGGSLQVVAVSWVAGQLIAATGQQRLLTSRERVPAAGTRAIPDGRHRRVPAPAGPDRPAT